MKLTLMLQVNLYTNWSKKVLKIWSCMKMVICTCTLFPTYMVYDKILRLCDSRTDVSST